MATVTHDRPQFDADQPKRTSRRDRRPAHKEPSDAEVLAQAAKMYPDTFDTPPTADEIAAEAYAIYNQRGGEHGRDQDDWLEAERRLREQRRLRDQR